MRQAFEDAQSALGFVVEQGLNIETKVYEQKYPEFNYGRLVPVVTEGNEWAVGTQFEISDLTGEVKWLNGSSTDMPFNEITRGKLTRMFGLAGNGFEYNLEEINQAWLYNRDLKAAKAMGARRINEQFLYGVAITGSTEKNMTGLVNDPNVSRVTFPNDGTGSSTLFSTKTAAQRYRDLDSLLNGIRVATNEIEYANTLALPPSIMRLMGSASTGAGDGLLTQLEFYRKNNSYTAETGQPLNIVGTRALVNAGLGGSISRIIAYRKDEEVLRFHLPMPFKMLPARQKSLMGIECGGIVRTGGTEIRLPGAMSYGDGA